MGFKNKHYDISFWLPYWLISFVFCSFLATGRVGSLLGVLKSVIEKSKYMGANEAFTKIYVSLGIHGYISLYLVVLFFFASLLFVVFLFSRSMMRFMDLRMHKHQRAVWVLFPFVAVCEAIYLNASDVIFFGATRYLIVMGLSWSFSNIVASVIFVLLSIRGEQSLKKSRENVTNDNHAKNNNHHSNQPKNSGADDVINNTDLFRVGAKWKKRNYKKQESCHGW